MAGSRLAAVRKVPEVHSPVLGSFVAPSERGKISYQAPQRASSRSTSSGCAADGLTFSRNGYAAKTACTSGEVAARSRARTGRSASRRAVTALANSWRGVVPAWAGSAAMAASMTRAPSSSMSASSMPASILIVPSWTQVAHGSDQPSTR